MYPLVGITNDSFRLFWITGFFKISDEFWPDGFDRGKVGGNLAQSLPDQTMGQVGTERVTMSA